MRNPSKSRTQSRRHSKFETIKSETDSPLSSWLSQLTTWMRRRDQKLKASKKKNRKEQTSKNKQSNRNRQCQELKAVPRAEAGDSFSSTNPPPPPQPFYQGWIARHKYIRWNCSLTFRAQLNSEYINLKYENNRKPIKHLNDDVFPRKFKLMVQEVQVWY